MLVFFTSKTSGRCRRTEGFLAQVLQRRHNHNSFSVRYVDREERPDLAERFRVNDVPTLMVVHDRAVRGTLVEPRGCDEIRTFLAPWMR